MADTPSIALARDMPFAKVVKTKDGDALLIGGQVYHVTGPDGNAADEFSIALRRVSRWGGSEMSEAELSCMDTCTPINEIPTLLSGSQINRPQFVGSDTLGGAKIGGKAAAPLGYRAYKPGHVFQGPDGQRYIVPGGEMKPFRWTKLLPYGGAPVPREGDEMPDWLHSQIMADLCQASS